MIHLGGENISNVYVGADRIIRGYMGADLVYDQSSGSDLPYPSNALKFKATQDNSSVTLVQEGTPTATSSGKVIYYYRDGVKYTYTIDTTINLNSGEYIYMWSEDEFPLAESTNMYKHFVFTGYVNVTGYMVSMFNGSMSCPDYGCVGLFRDIDGYVCDMSNLKLSATTVGDYGYAYMFCNSHYLENRIPRALPATMLGKLCYDHMFYSVWGMTFSHVLPATDLTNAYGCYEYMYAYTRVSSIVLPATNLGVYCYARMFQGAPSINYIKCLYDGSLNDAHIYRILYGANSSGTFETSASDVYQNASNGIPLTWTIKYIDS